MLTNNPDPPRVHHPVIVKNNIINAKSASVYLRALHHLDNISRQRIMRTPSVLHALDATRHLVARVRCVSTKKKCMIWCHSLNAVSASKYLRMNSYCHGTQRCMMMARCCNVDFVTNAFSRETISSNMNDGIMTIYGSGVIHATRNLPIKPLLIDTCGFTRLEGTGNARNVVYVSSLERSWRVTESAVTRKEKCFRALFAARFLQ